MPEHGVTLHGVDFTSAPSRRKAIVIASGHLRDGVFLLQDLQHLSDFPAFEAWLRRPGPWLAGFDLPFSLPRELVQHLDWPLQWDALMLHLQQVPRPRLRAMFKAFCDARPAGHKFAHRAADGPAGSSPSMKWVNPPVAFMLQEGAPRLLDAGLHIPGMHDADRKRIALEAYPGMLARSVSRASYKSDGKARQTPQRREQRAVIVAALESGQYKLGVPLAAGKLKSALVEDASGDSLDAVLCVLTAAWAWQRRASNYGLPAFDGLEGWIAGA